MHLRLRSGNTFLPMSFAFYDCSFISPNHTPIYLRRVATNLQDHGGHGHFNRDLIRDRYVEGPIIVTHPYRNTRVR